MHLLLGMIIQNCEDEGVFGGEFLSFLNPNGELFLNMILYKLHSVQLLPSFQPNLLYMLNRSTLYDKVECLKVFKGSFLW